MKKKKIRMLMDAPTLMMVTTGFLLITAAAIYLFVDSWNSQLSFNGVPAKTPHAGSYFVGGMYLPFGCIMLCILPRFFIVFTMSEEGVRIKAPFTKPLEIPWTSYKSFCPATYYHGSVGGGGYYPAYLVLARRRVTTDELQNVNRVSVDDKFLKIRVTKRNYRKLESILPPKAKLVLEKYYGEKYGGKEKKQNVETR